MVLLWLRGFIRLYLLLHYFVGQECGDPIAHYSVVQVALTSFSHPATRYQGQNTGAKYEAPTPDVSQKMSLIRVTWWQATTA